MLSASGATPNPTISTTPENRTLGLVITYTSARIPGAMCSSWPSRKLATAHHVRASISVNICWPTCA